MSRAHEERVMELAGLWRYPVKSLQGEPLDSAVLEDDGLLGDRKWGIRDERTGRILTARRRPELLAASARYEDDQPVITLPDGRTAVGPGRVTDRLLSGWLASAVSLVSASGSAGGTAEYFADATDDDSEAIEWTMPGGRYVDASPVLVLTTASLRIAASLHPDGVWDARRFRPNVLIDVAGEGWLEDRWIGRALQIGQATLRPSEPCVRCTMVTRAQPGLDPDVQIFRTLARHHRGHLGVWSDVLEPGDLSTGDRAAVGRSHGVSYADEPDGCNNQTS
jgi:MOSC domain-containing protein